MIIGAPHRYLTLRSPLFRAIILFFSSEQWSVIGFICLALAALAGFLHHPWLYAILLFAQGTCDINDGYAYRLRENGLSNGYGLYLDHMLDSTGASFAALGIYCLLGKGLFACVMGLVLFYLIAIHLWLYEINNITVGELSGAYYGTAVSKQKMLWLDVDDLTVIVAAIGIFRSVHLLYFTDTLLLIVFLAKVGRATLELRSTRWFPPEPDNQGEVVAGQYALERRRVQITSPRARYASPSPSPHSRDVLGSE